MTDPKRILEQDPDDFERSLLTSARLDVGSARARARCAAVAGAGVALSAKASAWSLAGKWLTVGLLAGFSTVGVATAVFPALPRLGRPSANTPAARPSTRALGARAPLLGAEPTPSAVAASGGEPLPPATSTPLAPERTSSEAGLGAEPATGAQLPRETRAAAGDHASVGVPTAALPALDEALNREVALLDSARRALRQGQPATALAALEQRQREFPRGALGPEASVVRVQALLAQGDHARAQAEAKDFLARHPDGAHAARIREALAASNP